MPDDPVDHDETRTPREFATFLLAHNKGRTHDELGEKLTELVAAVMETRKKGSLTFTLKVEPHKGVDDMVTVHDDIKLSAPQLDRPATMFYATEDGDMSLDHPNQQSMFSIQGEHIR